MFDCRFKSRKQAHRFNGKMEKRKDHRPKERKPNRSQSKVDLRKAA